MIGEYGCDRVLGNVSILSMVRIEFYKGNFRGSIVWKKFLLSLVVSRILVILIK